MDSYVETLRELQQLFRRKLLLFLILITWTQKGAILHSIMEMQRLINQRFVRLYESDNS